MRRIIPVLVGCGLLVAGGLWVTVRHRPSGSLLDEPGSPFAVETAAPGWKVSFKDSQIPLRALRWLAPRQTGILVAQVQTQNDRQLLAVFRDGAELASFAVARPQGVSEGFWRFAQLEEAFLGPGNILLLLYKGGDAAAGEASLSMAVEPGAAEARWVHRGFYDHMAVSGGTEQAVFLYGSKGPVQRLALAGGVKRPAAKDIELPPEVQDLQDLLPTGAWTFLAASGTGLSAYQGSKGWSHYPGPADKGLPCTGWKASLAQGGKRIWWQPAPGKLVQVGQDGTLVADREITGFQEADPQARDARLLCLMGADASGRLWFSLATPAPTVAPPEGEAAPEDWAGYAALGLDRAYRWSPDKESLERLPWRQAWTTLKAPAGMGAGIPRVHPAAGSLLLEGERAGWWVPLGALPFQPAGNQAK